MTDHCPTCGQAVKVVSADEGTSYYEGAAVEQERERVRAVFEPARAASVARVRSSFSKASSSRPCPIPDRSYSPTQVAELLEGLADNFDLDAAIGARLAVETPDAEAAEYGTAESIAYGDAANLLRERAGRIRG